MNVVMSYEYVDILHNQTVSINTILTVVWLHDYDMVMNMVVTWDHVMVTWSHTSMLVVNARFTTAFSITTWPTLHVCVGCTYVQAHVSMLWYVCMCTCMCVLVKQRTSLPDSTLKSDIVYGDSHTRQLSMSLSYTMKNKITSPKSWQNSF